MSYLIENLIEFCMPGFIHINELQSSVIPHLSLSLSLSQLHCTLLAMIFLSLYINLILLKKAFDNLVCFKIPKLFGAPSNWLMFAMFSVFPADIRNILLMAVTALQINILSRFSKELLKLWSHQGPKKAIELCKQNNELFMALKQQLNFYFFYFFFVFLISIPRYS